MPTIASHNPTKIPMIREEDIIALGDILEGKLACRDARSRMDGQTITERLFVPRGTYSGQAAPPAIHIFICSTVSAREKGGRVLPPPGFQPQPTRSSWPTWSSSFSSERPPFCFGSLICRHNSPGERPAKTIFCPDDGSDHFGLPGGMCAPERFAAWWHVSQRIAVTPEPSAPRFTFCKCT